MNKGYLHHIWRKLRFVHHWVFLGLALLFGFIALQNLRSNNLTALKLRDAVVAADEQNGDVEGALRSLRQYVYSHMNTNLASGTSIQHPVQLKYRYERLATAEKERVSAANAAIYAQAQATCEQQHPGGPLTLRASCAQEYISSRSVQEQSIPDDLYKFSFLSPRWSPDAAGWSIVLSGLFLIGFVVRFGMERWLRFELHQHN